MSSVSVDEAVGGIKEGRIDECAGIRRTRRDGAGCHQYEFLV